MSDDFVRLVSQANPATRKQYQPANTGYPPSSSPQVLDPFFDDDDDGQDDAVRHIMKVRTETVAVRFVRDQP